ncbi:YfhO family protein [Kribbella sp. NPDC023855]|uniref:YfhO family protein n=1 Tax=Kribbella sp. NPDC023855 TaxID=3154698 RepID=UPI00340372A4
MKGRRGLEMWLAGVMVAAAFSVAGAVRGTFPFGSASRSTNDLGSQYVPFFAHLWDVLHGQAQGDMFFNWQSAFGVGFWADYGVDLGSPLSLLVVIFPRERVDLAVFVITVLKLALAAAAMAAYLIRIRRGPRWLAALLGASYALCGWAVDDGAYVPMWLDGLIALPMFCLVAEWSVRRQHRILSIAVIAVFWISNFYTAYMATLAGGLILLARVLTSDLAWLDRLRAVLRHALSVILGIAASAPLLLPIFNANSLAAPSPPGIFTPVPVESLLARLIPLSEGVGRSPSLYVGTAALVLALSLPFNGSVATRTRAVWTVLAVALGASFLWEPTHVLWHGFDTPNGSQYRQAFTLCAVLVICAWLSAADRAPNWIALTAASALLVALALATRDSPLLNRYSVLVLALSAAAVIATMLTIRHLPRRRTLTLLAGIGLIAVIGAELTSTAVVIDAQRNKVLSAATGPWGTRHHDFRDTITTNDNWPRSRIDPTTPTTPNDPLLLGGQGPGYYSSLLPQTLNHTLTELGFGWSSFGRASYTMSNPVTDAIFSIATRLNSDDNTVTHSEVPPLVTVRSNALPAAPENSSAFTNQERLLGSAVYAVPKYKATKSGDDMLRLTATCQPGSIAYLHLPRVWGEARLEGGDWVQLTAARRPGINTSSAMIKLGEVPASGVVAADLKLFTAPGSNLGKRALGCLDPARLAKAIATLNANGATKVQVGGHSVYATLRPGSTGIVVIGTLQQPGWRCSTDNGPWRKPANYGGLLAVELPGPTRKVSCTYRPPGLNLGLSIGAGAVLLTLALALAGAVRRRRRAGSSLTPAEETAVPPVLVGDGHAPPERVRAW